MRESNYTYPPQNRAVTNITHLIYDRRALDTNSPLPLLNSLTSLTYLTSTSPRIREILTVDGGLERLLDILRDSCLPKDSSQHQDLWGLNGPSTARVITLDRANSLRHSLAFQCVVNIGVRGSEEIRTRVVQSGALDLVAQILESWLKDHGISIFSGSLGSQAAVDAVAAGLPVPGVEELKRRQALEKEQREERLQRQADRQEHSPSPIGEHPITGMAGHLAHQAAAALGFNLNIPIWNEGTQDNTPQGSVQGDTDVDMADAEGGETDDASVDADDASIDIDDAPAGPPSTTPRATTNLLPMTIPPRHPLPHEEESQTSSADASLSGDEPSAIPRNTSESDIAAATAHGLRPPALNLSSRVPQLAQDPISTQSSPMGTPTRHAHEGVEDSRRSGRRGTIVARPGHLAPRNDRERDRERRRDHTAGSGTSDGGEDIDLPTATIAAGIAAVNAQAMENNGTIDTDEPAVPPAVEIVETNHGPDMDEPDQEAIAAEQARLDMEAGAPPGQPGAAQTPRVAPGEAPTPRQAPGDPPPADTPDQAAIIIANSAPRGFHDLGSYVGISSLLNPDGNRYSDDSILLALQLLAYLSKYPHVRTAFHHPRRPMHATFDLGLDNVSNPLPERPAYSDTPDVFSLVERFTFRPAPTDPLLFKVPDDIKYWAGVIMRNACRKDEARGGIRQCANMSCGRWEKFSREFAKCRRCRKAKYCSKECQSKAWQEGHRFWCSSRADQEPGAAAAAAGNTNAAANNEDGQDEEEDYSLGMQMGLSPEVVTRAIAAARAAGIIRGPRQPEEVVNTHRRVAHSRGTNLPGVPRAHQQPEGPPPPPHAVIQAHVNLIEGQAAQNLLNETMGRLTRADYPARGAQGAGAAGGTGAAGTAGARGGDPWRRFQNVGTLLGLRNDNNTPNTNGAVRRQRHADTAMEISWEPDTRAGPSRGRDREEVRRGSGGVTGLGFNMSDQARR
ncbi:uncharacterized protein I303_105978 [Kwoniella dejecticola CBS 10117]|uniref:MYND-type domain-containing protein n=1 Tax=Kwoniella dejecticola CBS 10117 TaxID=1296121 RepID=A0A1A6A0Z0_9TREE|nr:uncharacterized protein I303_05998 [Kwoniella dejecticola CBS 10117]OBR83718.1 hypothetical protein I303_05998 [Kwoniella dejecticola CBS 10117]